MPRTWQSAGRERALVAGWIGSGKVVGSEGMRVQARLVGHIEAAWTGIKPLVLRPDLPPSLLRAIRTVDERYLGSFRTLRRHSKGHKRKT